MLLHVEVEEVLHFGLADKRLEVVQKLESLLVADVAEGGVGVSTAKDGVERGVGVVQAEALHVLPH